MPARTEHDHDELHARLLDASRQPWPDPDRGREIWHSGGFTRPGGHIADGHVVAYLEQQRDRVQIHGQCDGGCDRTQQIAHYASGQNVCPHTLETCHLRHIRPYLELWNYGN